jgi:hypothetical protein
LVLDQLHLERGPEKQGKLSSPNQKVKLDDPHRHLDPNEGKEAGNSISQSTSSTGSDRVPTRSRESQDVGPNAPSLADGGKTIGSTMDASNGFGYSIDGG